VHLQNASYQGGEGRGGKDLKFYKRASDA